MNARDADPAALWQVPYLPIDPKDIGRSYEAIIRINSQSGKGGVAYILETEFGFQLPKAMHVEFGKVIQHLADARGEEILTNELFHAFEQEYLLRTSPLQLESFVSKAILAGDGQEALECTACVSVAGTTHEIRAQGNGPIDAFVQALNQESIASFKVLSYSEHSLGQGSETRAVAYIQIQSDDKTTYFGAAIDNNIEFASIKAILSAVNRSQSQKD